MATSSNSWIAFPQERAQNLMDKCDGPSAENKAGVSTWCNFLFDFPDYYARSILSTDHFTYVQRGSVVCVELAYRLRNGDVRMGRVVRLLHQRQRLLRQNIDALHVSKVVGA